VVTGRKKPTQYLAKPAIYKMTIFAPNEVVATSRFWYFLRMLKKIKIAVGEIINVKTISETSPGTIKNFGIALKYDSRTGSHNMYREYRELTKADAVTACYRDMASRHQVRARSLHIISVDIVPASKTRRTNIKQFHVRTSFALC
jgi:large subunit ribosomal protein L18Ae